MSVIACLNENLQDGFTDEVGLKYRQRYQIYANNIKTVALYVTRYYLKNDPIKLNYISANHNYLFGNRSFFYIKLNYQLKLTRTFNRKRNKNRRNNQKGMPTDTTIPITRMRRNMTSIAHIELKHNHQQCRPHKKQKVNSK